jgi:type II secretion system protein L
MGARGCLLQETPSGWQVRAMDHKPATPQTVSVSVPETELAALAMRVREFVDERRLSRRRIVLAVGERSVCFIRRPLSGGMRPGDREAMTFVVEGSVPWDAEGMVADFACGEGFVTAVAIDQTRWLPLIAALEQAGLEIRSIVPGCMLAIQGLFEQGRLAPRELLLWRRPECCQLICVHAAPGGRGLPVLWRWFAGDAEGIDRELAMADEASDAPAGIVVIDELAGTAEGMLSNPTRVVRQIPVSEVMSGADDLTRQILSGRREPWFELRRGALTLGDPLRSVRSSLGWLNAAALVLLMTVGIVSQWRSWQIRGRLDEIRADQRALFQQTFPGARVPVAVVTRLESEREKVVASRETGDDVVTPPAALELLDRLLSALPSDLRLRILEARIEQGDIVLDLELRSHGDAGVIASALERSGFVVTPPTTSQRDDVTVSSRVRASWRAAESAGLKQESGAVRGEEDAS